MNDQVRLHGYSLLCYTVTTIDGYKLGLHRIPGPKNEKMMDSIKVASKKVPVLVAHGFSSTS